MKNLLLLAVVLGVTGCGIVQQPISSEPVAVDVPAEGARPQARPGKPVPATARTAEQFDTTTQAERVQAASAPPRAARTLGTTIASLGDPTQPGFWLKTPLVSAEQKGRIQHANGASVAVTLIPIDGPATAGSRISLPALRLLGVPLTSLPEVKVFHG